MERRILTLPREVVRKFCHKSGITENSFLVTVLTQVLHRFSREEIIRIVMLSSGRELAQPADNLGLSVQTLPLVSRITEGTVVEALNSIHSQIAGTLPREKFGVKPDGVKPEVLYIYRDVPIEKQYFSPISDKVDPLPASSASYPLSVEVAPGKDAYTIRFECKSSLYGADGINSLAKAFANVARGVSESESTTLLRDIEMIDAQECKELLRLGTGDTLDYDHSETFVDLFLRSVAQYPDSTAVVDSTSALTYRQLDTLSDAIAHRLIDEGVKTDDFVAVILPRVKELIAAIIGIWKAGAAYVPIDPEYPEERRRFIIEDSCAEVLIDGTFFGGVVDGECEPINISTPEGLACMMYTSGTTGRPKGVLATHSNLRAYTQFRLFLTGAVPGDVFAHYMNFSFIASWYDILTSFSCGKCLHILSENLRKDTAGMADYITEHKIRCMTLPTQAGILLLDSFPGLNMSQVMLVGEKLNSVVNTNVRIINVYGSTETITDATHIVDFSKDSADIPIGRPVSNSTVLIVDTFGNLLPRGAVGELCVAGLQVSKGYWHQKELTAKKFVDCHYLPGQKMYRTGDLARWNGDGNLEYLGRIDNVVKVRGFRVELEEIECNALSVEGTVQAAAALKDGDIVLYWSGESSEEDIRTCLGKCLAEFMLPVAYMHLESFPLTPNGKIDRKRLPEVELSAPGETVAPSTEREQIIFDIAKELLGVGSFGVTDDLKRFGMNSIRAMRLAMRLPAEWGIRISDINQSGSIRRMLNGKYDVVWFHKGYDPLKKTVAVVHGVVGVPPLLLLEDTLSKSFNVLIIENIYDTILSRDNIDRLVSSDGYNEFIRLYIQRIGEVMPKSGTISLLIGFSFGGTMAYDVACSWSGITGQKPAVVMGDSPFGCSWIKNPPTEACTPQRWVERIRSMLGHFGTEDTEKCKDDLIFTICTDRNEIRSYDGKVTILRAACGDGLNVEVKRNLKRGILYDLVRWLYWHLHIRDMLFRGRAQKTGISEILHNRLSQNNISAWKQCKPDIEMVDINSTHVGLFFDKTLIPKYLELIEHLVD